MLDKTFICEHCGKKHDGSFGSGRFCCYSCAHSRKHSEQTKLKISNIMKFKQYKFYYTYKTTNKLNGNYYYGMHMTDDLNDGYLGSGIYLWKAINKYGKQNFKKEILQYFKNRKDLEEAESKLITEEILKDPKSYNLALGGHGGPLHSGRKHSEQTKLKISKALTGKKLSLETRKKIADKNRNRYVSDETRKKISDKALNRRASDETRKKISDGVKAANARKKSKGIL